jgi:diacylglycerol kinase family enzyme
MPTHLLVANPTAQSGQNAARIDRARVHLATAGLTCTLLPTLPGGRTIGAVSEALRAGTYSTVISMGGDGTFREVAAGLLESGRAEEIPLGMLPTGTANDQGRSFGLRADDEALEENVAVLHAGRETRLDAGRLRVLDIDEVEQAAAWFFDSAGWGMSARVLARRNRDRKLVEQAGPLAGPLKEIYRDQLVYAGALLAEFLKGYMVDDKFTAYVTVDGETHVLEGLTDLVVKATAYYGGAWIFDRTARHDDGLFEIVPFHGRRDWTSKAIVDVAGNPLHEEVLNRVGIRHSHPFRAARASIRLEPPAAGAPLAAQIDGEEFTATVRAEIEVVPRALRLIVP